MVNYEGILVTDTNIHEEIKKIWMDVLNVNEINDEDSFFDLKGNSLQALIMFEMLRKKLNIELLIQDIFEHETLKAFVQYVEMKKSPYDILVKGRADADIAEYDKQVINKDVIKSVRDYNSNTSNEVDNTYKMLKFHRYFIRMGYTNYLSILSTIISVKNCKDEEKLLLAIKQVVKEQTVLRTGVSDNGINMVVYKCNDWKIPVVDKDKIGNWDEFIDNLAYIRNEPSFFGEKGLLSKIFVLKISESEYEVRLFIHHCLWDRMSHIIIVKSLESELNSLNDKGKVEAYSDYIETKRASIIDQFNFQYKMALKYVIPVMKYKNAIKGKKCFDVTACWELDDKTLEEFKNKPVLKNIELYSSICRNLKLDLKKIPCAVLTSGRESENSTTLGMYINTVSALYNSSKNTIYGVLNGDTEFSKSKNDKLQFEMCNTKLFEIFSKSVPIINYVGLFPGYHDASENLLEVKEIMLDKPVENRLTSFIDGKRIHLTMKVYADSKEDAINAITKTIY